MVLKYLQDKKQ